MSVFVRLSNPDIISMTIESGIQNTGIAIFMLKFCLGQPAADITTGNTNLFLRYFLYKYLNQIIVFLVVPVAVALMTPIPLLIGFIIKKCYRKKDEIIANQDPATESMLKNDEIVVTSPNVENATK